MNQRFWNGLFVALLTTGIGTTSSSYAEPTPGVNQGSQVKQSPTQRQGKSVTATPTSTTPQEQPTSVVKVGEYQSGAGTEGDRAVIAKVNAYELAGRQAATLYVRSIPVLTFLSSRPVAESGTKKGEVVAIQDDSPNQKTDVAMQQAPASQPHEDADNSQDDPVRRATAIAAKLNQLSGDNVDANTITVSRKPKCKCYSIKVNSEELVEINANTILADTTHKRAIDALQATNRLRRLMGNAPPLARVAGMPENKPKQISLLTVRFQINGMASWYGPGDDGTKSASGEIFRQNALTAAHRSLPFGTKVRVTNLKNGRSVVVRINDRGPYIRGRIIDLSTGAARVLLMFEPGVVPVRVDVLGVLQRQVLDEE